MKRKEEINILIDLAIIFSLNAISTSLGTLKTIFLSKQTIKPVYVTTFLDALVFAYACKLMSASTGFFYILAFAMGRIAGVFIGDLIDKKIAIGLLEITVYKHAGEGKVLADQLRASGYSVTTEMGYGMEGKHRLVLNIIVTRRDFPELRELLFASGKVNMTIKNVAKVYGKVGCRRIASSNA